MSPPPLADYVVMAAFALGFLGTIGDWFDPEMTEEIHPGCTLAKILPIFFAAMLAFEVYAHFRHDQVSYFFHHDLYGKR